MKTLHFSIIIGIVGMAAIGVATFTLIDLQSKNNESDKYVFEGNYEISKDMSGSLGGKSFFVSQSYPENYVNDSIQFHGVIFSTLDRNNDNNPSGFVSNLVRFSDGINETLTTGYGGHPPNTITVLTKHQNPQAGLTRYNNGSVNFLVNTSSGTASTQKVTAYRMFYYSSIPQLKYVIKQGQTIVIPVDVYYTERDALHLTAFTNVQYCGPIESQMYNSTNPDYQIPKQCNMIISDSLSNPSDLTAVLEKNSFDFQAVTTNETTPRDTTNLTISSLPDAKTGVYRIAIGLTTDGNGVNSKMLYVDVR